MRATSAVILTVLHLTSAFSPPLLAGAIDGYPGLHLTAMSPASASLYFKCKQVVSVSLDAPESVVRDFGMAKVWCNENKDNELASVSVLHKSTVLTSEESILYSVLYRKSAGIPAVINICGMLCNNTEGSAGISILHVAEMIKVLAKSKGCHLQVTELYSTWHSSTLKLIVHLETCKNQKD